MVAVASQRVVVCNNLKRTPNLASMSDELEKDGTRICGNKRASTELVEREGNQTRSRSIKSGASELSTRR